MNFREIKIGQLEDYVKSEEFRNSKVLPISTPRALSQFKNPRANKDDICLILAEVDHEIVGYIGILPDKIVTDKEIRVGWNSCWWTDPVNGKGTAMPLFYKALESWNNKVLFSDLTPLTKTIIDKSGDKFYSKTFEGVRGFLRFNLFDVLPAKKAVFGKIGFLLRLADAVCNLILSPRLVIWRKKILKRTDWQLNYIEEVDNESYKFIKKHSNNELIHRGIDELNWIIKNPWIKSIGIENDSEVDRYYFSLSAKRFQYYCVKIYQKERLISFIMLSQRNMDFKIPYCYFEENKVSVVCHVIYQILIENNARTFTTFNSELADHILGNNTPFFYKRKIPKYFAVTKDLKEYYVTKPFIQDGDGDMVFT